MKNLLIIIIILFSCSKKEQSENFNSFQITIRYSGPQDAPSPIIVLKNSNPTENIFPVSNYKMKNEDLKKIEKICYSEQTVKKGTHPLVLVEVKRDNNVQTYLYNKTDGMKILNKIEKIISAYSDKRLNDNFFGIKYATQQNWHGDGKIIEH